MGLTPKLLSTALLAVLVGSASAEPFYVGKWTEIGLSCVEGEQIVIAPDFIDNIDQICTILSSEVDGRTALLEIDCHNGEGTGTAVLESAASSMLRVTLPFDAKSIQTYHRCDAPPSRAPAGLAEQREH